MHHTHATLTPTTPPPPLPRPSWVSDYVPPVRLSPRALITAPIEVTDPVESQHEIEIDDGEEVQS